MSYEAKLLKEAIDVYRDARGTADEKMAYALLRATAEAIKSRHARRAARGIGGGR